MTKYREIIRLISLGLSQRSILRSLGVDLSAAFAYYSNQPEYAKEVETYRRIFQEDFSNLSEEEIKSTGYVVHSLEAALWCLLTTDSYRACVLKAVNLGDDTDTVAAIAGGLADARYGYDAIPKADGGSVW